MDIFSMKYLEKGRQYRSRKLLPLAQVLLRLHISANIMTFISLAFGLLAVYFLFQNHLIFSIMAILHLIADGLDGVLARETKPTKFGKYFDIVTDDTITLILLLKIGLIIDYYALLIAALYFITQTIYIVSRTTFPILLARTLFIIVLIVKLPVLAYLVIGFTSFYSMARQLQWFVKKFK